MSYRTKIYREQGGSKFVAASGGEIEVQSGGTVDLQGALNLATSGSLKRSWISATADVTLTAARSGQTYKITQPNLNVDLPAATTAGAGVYYSFVLATGGLSTATGFVLRPASGDFITGNGLGSTDGEYLRLSATGDREGDMVTVECDGADGWYITRVIGTWSKIAAT